MNLPREYIHIVGYFRRDIGDRLAKAESLVASIEEQYGTKRKDVLLSVITPSQPPAPWKRKGMEPHAEDGSWWYNLHAKSVPDLATWAKQDHVSSMRQSVRDLGIGGPRRGAEHKFFDFMWDVQYDESQLSPVGQSDAMFLVVLRLDCITNRSGKRVMYDDLVTDLVQQICAAGDLYYLLVDVVSGNEIGDGGTYYGTHFSQGCACLARGIERELWQSMGPARHDFVRGVFWGNYFSPELLERLGGKEMFKREYIEYAKIHNHHWRDLVTEIPDGGLFVRISGSPRDCSARLSGWPHLGYHIPTWLYNRLNKIGAMI